VGRIHVVILAGGKGTRFWPEGRESRPKQMLALDGDDPRPLVGLVAQRVAALCRDGSPWIVAPRSLEKALRAACPGVARARFLWEPAARNTAAAVAFAAAAIAREDPGAAMVVVPADHHVAPAAAYRTALTTMGARAAESGRIVTLGLKPTFPATGYGYLHVGASRGTSRAGAFRAVRRYVEKPSLAVAKRFVKGGKHLWNAGTFAFRPEVFLDALARHEPAAGAAFRGYVRTGTARALARAYAMTPATSVDYAVMERERDLEALCARLSWDDLGSWDAVIRHAAPDRAGNRLPRGAVAVDATDNFARALDGTAIALLGVSDLVVVRTRDALLVAKRGRGEDVREVVARWRAAGREDLLR
jgi:mannose-1-phosphate guanylyltransferase/mannose-6-phosphate isomerase